MINSRRQFLRDAAALSLTGLTSATAGCGKPHAGPASGPIGPGNALRNGAATFRDVTHECGLAFVQQNGGCGRRFFVEQIAAGAAVFDANGDGHPDIYFPAPKPLRPCTFNGPLRHRLYLNDGKGNFTLSPSAFGGRETDYGIAAAVGDYNNDGHPDLFVACHGKSSLFKNRGDGSFEDVTEKSGLHVTGFASGGVWFDYDNDGFLDLYVPRYCDWTLENNMPCPGKNDNRAGCDPTAYRASTHLLFHNNGNGTFTDVSNKLLEPNHSGRGLGVAAADFNCDGSIQLFVCNDMGPNFLLVHQDGVLKDEAMQRGVALGGSVLDWQANMGVAVGDYNNSGRLSAAVTTFVNEPYTLYRNDGRVFTNVTEDVGLSDATMQYLGFGTGFVDTRNNGWLDLFFANGHVVNFEKMKNKGAGFKQRNQLMLNDGGLRFVESMTALPKTDVKVHRAACFADFNGDGRMDILVTASNGEPTLLRNESPPANWLMVQLTNRHGCVTPIGTRCVATVGDKRLTRVVLGGGSYAGDSFHRVHFGLGPAPAVDTLEVHWPGGHKQSLSHIPANQILRLVEQA